MYIFKYNLINIFIIGHRKILRKYFMFLNNCLKKIKN